MTIFGYPPDRTAGPISRTRQLILCFLLCLPLSSSSVAQSTSNMPDEQPIKVSTVLANVPLIVTDRSSGRNIAGLTRSDFTIMQGSERQQIDFFADAESPISVAIVIDTSESTRYVLHDIREAAREFVWSLHADDKAAIISADYRVAILQSLTSDRKRLEKGISNAQIASSGGSLVLDGMDAAINRELSSAKGRKAVIVLTDGYIGGKKSHREFINDLIETDPVVYPIFFQTAPLLPERIKKIPIQELVKLRPVDFLYSMAQATGGKLFAAGSTDFKSSFQAISDELRHEYVIGFYPNTYPSPENNRIDIKVDRNDAVVRTKTIIRLKQKPPTQ